MQIFKAFKKKSYFPTGLLVRGLFFELSSPAQRHKAEKMKPGVKKGVRKRLTPLILK